jgi:hypothetical protein
LGLTAIDSKQDACFKTEKAAERAIARPKPTISDLLTAPFDNTPKLLCPPTPTHYINKNLDSSAFASKALSIIERGSIEKNGYDFFLNKMRGMHGEHSQIYSISSDGALCNEVSNNDIFIKIFLKELIETKGASIETEFLKNSLTQYDELQTSGLSTIKIYNRDTAHLDGYLVVERLDPFIIPWDRKSKVEKLSEQQIAILQQIKTFVSYAMQSPSSIPLDLQAANFGLNAEGQLTLLDFMERDEEEPYAFSLIAKKCLLSLSNYNKEIYQELRQLALAVSDDLYRNLKIS